MQWPKWLRLMLLALRLAILIAVGAIVGGAVLLPWVEVRPGSRIFRPDHLAEVLGVLAGACLHTYLLRRRRTISD